MKTCELGEFPRCKKCYSKRPFETEWINREKNIWKLSCLDCGWTRTKAHVQTIWEIKDGVIWIDGKLAKKPAFMLRLENSGRLKDLVFTPIGTGGQPSVG